MIKIERSALTAEFFNKFRRREGKGLFPALRDNLLRQLRKAPEEAQAYFQAMAEGTDRLYRMRGDLFGRIATPFLVAAKKRDEALFDWALEICLGIPLNWRGKKYPEMDIFSRKAVPLYSERFSLVRDGMILAQMGYIPKLIESGHPQTDRALDIHFRMMFDWYTEVCERATFGMLTIFPALIRAEHPRAAQALELMHYFSRDQNTVIMGNACKALARAAVLYYGKEPVEFDRIVELLVRRAMKSEKLPRRAHALEALSFVYRFLYLRGEALPLRLRIMDVFMKNAKYTGRDTPKTIFAFAAQLCRTGEGAAALALARKAFESIRAEGKEVIIVGDLFLERLLAAAAGREKGSPELVEYIVDEVLAECKEYKHVEVPAHLTGMALSLREHYPREAKQIMERAIHLAAAGEAGLQFVRHGYHDILELTAENISRILEACKALGVDPLKIHLFAGIIGEPSIDNRRVGQLRDEVTQLRTLDQPLGDYFEFMLHCRPSPFDLKDVRYFIALSQGRAEPGQLLIGRTSRDCVQPENLSHPDYVRALRKKKEQVLPSLLRMEQILSEVYEYNPNLVREKLLALSKTVDDPDFGRLRLSFMTALEQDKIGAAKLLGPLMDRAAEVGEMPAYDRFRLISQLHYLGYGLFNTAYQELFVNFNPERVNDVRGILHSLLLAVRAVGFRSPAFEEALKWTERDGVDNYALMALSQLIHKGTKENVAAFADGIAEPVNAAAGKLRISQFYTDQYIRASLLHQLSEAAMALTGYLQKQDLFPRAYQLAQTLKSEEHNEWMNGAAAYAEKTDSKLMGQVIRLARGYSPVEESGLEVWREETRQGTLELYLYAELSISYPRGRAFLNGRELSVKGARAILDVTLSDATLMAMWRGGD